MKIDADTFDDDKILRRKKAFDAFIGLSEEEGFEIGHTGVDIWPHRSEPVARLEVKED